MKVIFITRESYQGAGARIRCFSFAKELQKYGVETEVLSYPEKFGAKDGEYEKEMGLVEKFRYNLAAWKYLAKKPDAIFYLQRVHYHSLAPWLVAIINSNKLILDLDDWEMRETPSYRWGFYPTSKAEYLLKKIVRKANGCIAAGKYLYDFLLQYQKNVHYLPSGVDTNLFTPTFNTKYSEKLTFSWIGTMHRQDNVENIKFILQCFSVLQSKYAHIYLEIVGRGIYFEEVKKLVHNFSLDRVTLRKWIPPEQIPSYLDKIDVGLLPLIQDIKFNLAKSPCKLFEYMAMGKTTVCSNQGEARFIIEDQKNGLLASKQEEFMAKMESLITNKNWRQQLGHQALATVQEKYSLKVLGQELYQILKNI